MLGLLYIILNFFTGFVICSLCIPRLSLFTRKTYLGSKISLSPALLSLPLWYITGAFLMTWVTYFTAYLAMMCGAKNPLVVADIMVMPFFALFDVLGVLLLNKRHKLRKVVGTLWRNPPTGDIIFAFLAFLFAAFLMWWTFSYQNGTYRVGISVFSDFAPHLGMIRSFSKGTNFPTSYSHFAGEDIKYHFLFQFMVGNLELLGLRLDWAFNLPSAICFAGAFCLLYVLAVKISGKKAVGWVAALLFAFRSSDAVFDYLAKPTEAEIKRLFPDLLKKTPWFMIQGDPDKLEEVTWDALKANEGFVGTTTHEDWGLWNLNVYCNQRHLAIGLCAMLCLILFLLPPLFAAIKRIRERIVQAETQYREEDPEFKFLYAEKVANAIRYSLATKEGWLARNWVQPIFLGCLLGMCSFFNGACVIGCLCVLFVLAIVSDRRLEYAIVAAITVAFTLFATHFFIDGSAVDPQYYFGFLADTRTFAGAWEYIMTLCGILPFVLLAAFVLSDGTRKWVMFAFTAPFILAFTTSLTIDITVNHKYIMMSLMLLAVPAAYFLVWLWERAGAWPKIVCVLLIFVLTATGLYDLRTVIRKNDPQKGKNVGYIALEEDDPITEWIAENTTSKDIFLSPYYSLNNVVMGGAMLYYGWPYYAWSAGYDTPTRQKNVTAMYEASSQVELMELVMEYGIRYIIVDDEARRSSEYDLNETVIKMTYKKVMENRDMAIYDTREVLDSAYLPLPDTSDPDTDIDDIDDGYDD
ncbi:MAG: hypothetical protein J5649_11150 [Lachnospiraceae bacterium]|nr:hypothetical protein [Lachnospiraceae bacterium]